MTSPFATILEHFRETGISFEEESDPKTASFRARGELAVYDVFLAVNRDDTVVRVRTLLPFLVPENLRLAAAEFLTRANDGLYVGGFQFQMDDGLAGFTIGHLIPTGEIDRETLQWMIDTSIALTERYLPAFTQVVFAGALPADAIFLTELPEEDAATGDDDGAPESPDDRSDPPPPEDGR